MTRGRIAVEIERAGRLEDAVEFDQARRHHGEVGHHVVLAEETAHGFEHARDTKTGQFMDRKADDKPFKGVRKEK